MTWADGEAEREWAGLVALDAVVPDLAPVPVTREVEDGAPVVVMSRLPGSALGGAPMSAAQVDALTSSLPRLFAVPVGTGLPERAAGPTEMRGLVRGLAREHYDLAARQDQGLVGRALHQARGWVEGECEHDLVVDEVLSRGYGNLANLVWDGRRCRFVDFEDFGVSDLTDELADLVEHASSRLSRLLDVVRLLAGYPLTQDQQVRLDEHRRVLAVFWLVMLLPGNRGFDRNPAGSAEDQARHVLSMLG
nr:phosphotransferase [Nocardioides lianchengensis]